MPLGFLVAPLGSYFQTQLSLFLRIFYGSHLATKNTTVLADGGCLEWSPLAGCVVSSSLYGHATLKHIRNSVQEVLE